MDSRITALSVAIPGHQSAQEQDRIAGLYDLCPSGGTLLDIGARDGYLTRILAGKFKGVTAIDLTCPTWDHPGITTATGDVTHLRFPDGCFSVVSCAEVLEHVKDLATACAEIERVSGGYVVLGVPFQQDTRTDQLTCSRCRLINPPWGHINIFTEAKIASLFPQMVVDEVRFVGEINDRTNSLSVWLMNMAGNPYGAYNQQEPCIHCGSPITRPPLSIWRKALSSAAAKVNSVQRRFCQPHPIWIHVRLRHGHLTPRTSP